jgi:hypothetical protein
MVKVFSFSSGHELSPEEIDQRSEWAAEQAAFDKEVGRLAEERIPQLEQRLESMGLAEALETKEENPDAIVDDIEQVKMEDIRTVTDRQGERLIYETYVEHLAQTGQKLTDRQRRALGNLIQLCNKDQMIERRSGLALREPAAEWDERVQRLRSRIEEKQTKLLRAELGEVIARQVEQLELLMQQGMRDRGWQDELAERTRKITNSPQYDPHRFIDALEFISSVSVDGREQPTDLTRTKNIKEARQAFETGDPTNVKNQFNPVLRSAAEYARQGQIEVSKLRAAETIKFIREKLQNQLVLFSRKDIREI